MHSFKLEFCYGTCGCKKCDWCYLFLAHAASGKCNIPSAHPDKVSTFCKKKNSLVNKLVEDGKPVIYQWFEMQI